MKEFGIPIIQSTPLTDRGSFRAHLNMAHHIAKIDVLAGLAEAATLHRYHRPTIHEGHDSTLRAVAIRLSNNCNRPGGFVPNDTYLDLDTHRLLLITG
ncbi:MAG: hypothetical protein R3B83_02980 [Nitrospirales bacterium]|nr:hypothetical protein [Nitrospirales bacterium]